MKTTDWKDTSVGEIVAEDFAAAKVFKKYGIDFCCHGEVTLETACASLKLAPEEVMQALKQQKENGEGRIPFSSWPLDLLMDYILKIHHRGIRKNGPELLTLLEKVERVHGEAPAKGRERAFPLFIRSVLSTGTGTTYGTHALRNHCQSDPGDENGT